MKSFLIFSSLISSLFLVNSCKPKEVVIDNETELITSVDLYIKDSLTNQTSLVQFRDPDGAGGVNPIAFDSIVLKSNSTYLVKIVLLDESKSPVDTISNDVLEEGVDHQFFFNSTLISLATFYEDSDANGNPIGLQSKWKTGNSGKGSIMVVLKHQPGIKDGLQTTGETDVEVNFPTRFY